MINDDGSVNKSHTTSKVPFIICRQGYKLKEGKITNIAPTILELLKLEKPAEMVEDSLLEN
jgi:2,3-bisphosphoglycerate-independent phosphoglycerate mutase